MVIRSSIVSWVLYVCRILLIVLFTYAAVSKLVDFQQFGVQLGQSPLLTAFADYLVLAVPLSEIAIVVLLLIKPWRLFGYYASFSILLMFTTYIVLTLNFSDYVPCSCGGVLEDLGWSEHIIFNLAFVLLATFGVLYLEKSFGNLKKLKDGV